MIGALWTGISGLASHQSALDNESHNIANVNTVGYKSSRISFADQMYQDRIGKGSKILDAEKLYVQGNLKLTGVDYDMALSGDGFFTVINNASNGTSSSLYTRAGNFRMGDNGTLQDAAGNEVQGWAMTAIDTDKDVTSTNPNVSMFTSDYSKVLSSKVISHSNYIETITAKATDYTSTAVADSSTIFEGAGAKSKSAKISDVEALVSDYASWLSKLKDDPDGGSASSTAQISQVNFKSSSAGLVSKEGDQIYVYIDGTKYSQNYVSESASTDFIEDFLGSTDSGKASIGLTAISTPPNTTMTIDTISDNTRYQLTIDGETVFYDSGINTTITEILDGIEAAVNANSSITPGAIVKDEAAGTIDFAGGTGLAANTFDSSLTIDYDIAASRIATYKALSDTISEVPGLRAYMVSESDDSTGNNDILQSDENFELSTYNIDMIKGIIQIESLIPGTAFSLTEAGESSGTNTVAGSSQTSTSAVAGTGVGALTSARDALAKAITGKQQDVYTPSDLGLTGSNSLSFSYGISIYDQDIENNIPVPGSSSTTPNTEYKISISGASSIDDIVDAINGDTAYSYIDTSGVPISSSSYNLSDYITAKNINGNLVIETLEKNYDADYSSSMAYNLPSTTATESSTATTSTISGAALKFVGEDYTYTYNDSGTVPLEDSFTISSPTSLTDMVDQMNTNFPAGISAALNATGDSIIVTTTNAGADFTEAVNAPLAESTLVSGTYTTPIDKNNDYSGSQGAGAEFIELVNTIEQTSTQDSLQLKLDTLGISDSAFGEFSVDSSGVISMTQDGVDFAIGQVAIALFNNNRGLDPSGDNLLAKTNDSGEPIYNLNNEKTAKVEAQTLELSTADLSESLVNLMVFQRAFEANAKSITTSDELLNTLINLKR